mmetsp:Transcript_21307/g.59000  ORF Transcript_21307/g.59000 Transcript_21307/m.59000 type:complete len:561 (-) Transcript_21307:441-2123(-)
MIDDKTDSAASFAKDERSHEDSTSSNSSSHQKKKKKSKTTKKTKTTKERRGAPKRTKSMENDGAHNKLLYDAQQARNKGEDREAADLFLDAFCEFELTTDAEKWHSKRWFIFCQYCWMFTSGRVKPLQEDMDFLDQIKRNREDVGLFRIHAAETRAWLLGHYYKDPFDACDEYKDALDLAKNAVTVADREGQTLSGKIDEREYGLSDEVDKAPRMRFIGDILDANLERIRQTLRDIEEDDDYYAPQHAKSHSRGGGSESSLSQRRSSISGSSTNNNGGRHSLRGSSRSSLRGDHNNHNNNSGRSSQRSSMRGGDHSGRSSQRSSLRDSHSINRSIHNNHHGSRSSMRDSSRSSMSKSSVSQQQQRRPSLSSSHRSNVYEGSERSFGPHESTRRHVSGSLRGSASSNGTTGQRPKLAKPSTTVNHNELSREQMDHLLSQPGKVCDQCGIIKERARTRQLFKCSKCEMACYCSERCQSKAWSDGHDLYCRKPGVVKKNDLLQLQNLDSKPTWNGQICKVLGPAPNGRFEVVRMPLPDTPIDLDYEPSFSVSASKLGRLRPLK